MDRAKEVNIDILPRIKLQPVRAIASLGEIVRENSDLSPIGWMGLHRPTWLPVLKSSDQRRPPLVTATFPYSDTTSCTFIKTLPLRLCQLKLFLTEPLAVSRSCSPKVRDTANWTNTQMHACPLRTSINLFAVDRQITVC